MADDWQAAWQGTIDAVGGDFSGGVTSTAVDQIELGAVRKFLEPLELDCPLHYDPDAAKQHGYRNVLAPVAGISSTWLDAGLWRPGMGSRYPQPHPHVDIPRARTEDVPEPPVPNTTAAFATDIEIEYFEPAVVGDRLTVRGRTLLSCVPRETRVGRGAFMVWEREVVNQDGVRVALLRNGSYSYVPLDAPEDASSPREPEAAEEAAPEEDLIAIRNVEPGDPPAVDWSNQRYWEDVQEGDAIPPVAINLTIARLVVEAGANRDFNQIHHNTPVSIATGAPDMYANNGFIQAWWERAVREYIGLGGRFKKTGPFRMRIFNTVGESAVTSGTVKRKWVEDGEHLVEIEVQTEISRGTSVGPGPVVVSLPTRS
ncbi:MAG: MaoC family dehydratase N-terminal domain-containing protein [Chloroflexi bacterium]|nr:MaoC family dehydratase N-terminal domain-containing protein [Chloroflexota bacterium]